MSKENVKLFYDALTKDKGLQEKAKAIGQKYAGQRPDKAQTELIYQKELVPLAREAGFDFTAAEIKEYAEETKQTAIRELSEEELTAVAGGSPCACVLIGGGSFGSDGMICGGWGHISGTYDGREYFCLCAVGGGGTWK